MTFETSVRVKRPIEDVFGFLSDPLLLPRWNSAAQSVQRTSGEGGSLGSTYSMQRQLPIGRQPPYIVGTANETCV
jgi:carbon monoxide dehydrogenase subunit G